MGLKLIEGFKAFGLSVGGVQTQLRTDEVGRMKISHAQPPAISGAITGSGQSVAVAMDSLSDVIFYLYGAAHAGVNITFEQSPDSTDGTNGTWFPVLAKNQGAVATVASATGALTANSSTSWAVSAPGASYVRARATAWTSGSLTVIASGSTAARPTDVTVAGAPTTVTANLGTGGTGATALGKAEDAVAASGDTGVAMLGVRVPTTPAAQTSAAGDYGAQAITAEGKTVISGRGAEELSWQSRVDLTTTADVAQKASAGAGVRNYVTDVTVENTGASPARLLLKDGATIIWSGTIPAGQTLCMTQTTPLKGSAATAINAALAAAGTVTLCLSGYIGV